MTIPVKIKLFTTTAKSPEQANDGDLWDLFADDFSTENLQDLCKDEQHPSFCFIKGHLSYRLNPQSRILVKTGIALQLPKQYGKIWSFDNEFTNQDDVNYLITTYAVADIRPRSGLALKHGITILNSPATIDNSYRKEIGVILYNAGSQSYTISKGDKIAQMLIRPLYPSKLIQVEDFEDTGRGGYGSTGK